MTRRHFSYVILIVAALLAFSPTVYSRASAERPLTQRYTLSPVITERLLRAVHVTAPVKSEIDLRPYFVSQGVTFDGDCKATLTTSTRTLTVINTLANRQLVELIFEHVLRATIESPRQARQSTGSAH
jgi:hypothetical protein